MLESELIGGKRLRERRWRERVSARDWAAYRHSASWERGFSPRDAPRSKTLRRSRAEARAYRALTVPGS